MILLLSLMVEDGQGVFHAGKCTSEESVEKAKTGSPEKSRNNPYMIEKSYSNDHPGKYQ